MDFAEETSTFQEHLATHDIDWTGTRELSPAAARRQAAKVAETARELGLDRPPPEPAKRPGRGKLPRPWIDAALRVAGDDRARGFADLDRYATSTLGYAAMLDAYGGCVLPSDVPMLETRLRKAVRKRDEAITEGRAEKAACEVAARIEQLAVLPLLETGSRRRQVQRRLDARGTELRAGHDPFGPVHVRPTPFPFRWVLVKGKSIGEIRTRYIDVAPSKPKGTLLLIHGHGSLLEEYDDLTALLAEHYRVVVPDLPGCGYSDKHERRYTVKYYADFLMAFLRRVGIQRCVPCGGSLGGNLALTLAHRDRERQALFPKAVSWAPAGGINPNFGLSELARIGRNTAPAVFFLSYNEQKGAWYTPKWRKRNAALQASDLFRNEVYCRGYHVAYFDIARDQTRGTKLVIAHEITQPVLLMCGPHDNALGMYTTVRNELFPALKSGNSASHFQDEFRFGCHSLANEDTDQVASYIMSFVGKV